MAKLQQQQEPASFSGRANEELGLIQGLSKILDAYN